MSWESLAGADNDVLVLLVHAARAENGGGVGFKRVGRRKAGGGSRDDFCLAELDVGVFGE